MPMTVVKMRTPARVAFFLLLALTAALVACRSDIAPTPTQPAGAAAAPVQLVAVNATGEQGVTTRHSGTPTTVPPVGDCGPHPGVGAPDVAECSSHPNVAHSGPAAILGNP